MTLLNQAQVADKAMTTAADDTPEMVEVTDADREAVQAFHREMGRRLLSDIKDGTETLYATGTDVDPIYQSFAHHRLASTKALREALEQIVATEPKHGHKPYATPNGAFVMPYDPRPVQIARDVLASGNTQ